MVRMVDVCEMKQRNIILTNAGFFKIPDKSGAFFLLILKV